MLYAFGRLDLIYRTYLKMVTDNADTRPRNGPNGLKKSKTIKTNKTIKTIKMVADNADTRPRNGPNSPNGLSNQIFD